MGNFELLPAPAPSQLSPATLLPVSSELKVQMSSLTCGLKLSQLR